MEKYDYRKAMCEDIKNWILANDAIEKAHANNWDRDDFLEYLNDELWDDDSITGNGYHYYDTEDKCAEYVAHNLDLFLNVIDDWGSPVINGRETPELFKHPAQYADCTIRCYLFWECADRALDELGYPE